ncbi:Sodium/calcium exchanger protein-domain-containing protein [Collybia nuda]|uniref:Vacuolar calcium ion transporter n=1 Tax=Collybia nuda TaxID=64659 RepID=A0A9P5Y8R3_9AGAR|nr:Sodium/calcium exchanger protein-domain-containing protein [Collybia nuda]
MGESFATLTHNVSNHVLPQPTPLVAEDDDEPPSSGSAYRSSEMKGGSERSSTTPAAQDNKSFDAVHNSNTFVHTSDNEKHDPSFTPLSLEVVANGRSRAVKPAAKSKGERLRTLFTPTRPLGPRPTYVASLMATIKYTPLNICLLFIPVSWALHFTHQSATLVFIFSALGIIPLAALLGLGTEQIALRTSQSVGGLLNATLGNIVEMIIAGIALQQCELELVQSSLLGGLLSNLLLVLGMAFIVGGFRFPQQEFQPMVAQLNSSLMIVCVISLIIPVAFHEYLGDRLPPGKEVSVLLQLSRGSAIILMLIYVAYLFFQFYSHNHLLPIPITSSASSTSSSEEHLKLNAPFAVFLLVASTALAYVTAEHLVGSLEGLVAANPSISKEFITLIVIPVISNAAEHTTAVVVARKGKFDLAMSVAVGSCIQIALFVIPLLVLIAWGMDKPLTLLFDSLETVVLFFSVLLVKFSVEDGKSHWLSGVVLIAVYFVIALSFWNFPETVRTLQGQALTCN